MILYLLNLLIFFTDSCLLHKFLHLYQLKSYNNFRYLKYFKKKKSLFILFCLFFYIIELLLQQIWIIVLLNLTFYILNLIYIKNFIQSKKTPLKFTKKLLRIEIFSILILSFLCFYKNAFLLIIALTPFIPMLANFINIYDKIKAHHFIYLARKKIANSNVKIIAITGSNGKTSVKNILQTMLSKKFITQATPSSFNTPLGIAKFINEELKFSTQFLILEYGARKRGDIKKLCKLYGADFGILTTITGQHLETFKSIENVFLEKNYLAEFLQNKLCIFNLDNIYCLRGYLNKTGEKLGVSINSKSNISASDITLKNFMMNFNLNIKTKEKNISTKLLGFHNITNICLCAAMAQYLGVSEEDIFTAVENLEPTPHRLELIQTHVNILDDSYNCSPASAAQAVAIFHLFPNKKMVVTPGIIEGGKNQYFINFTLGIQLASFDFCIIVGETNKQAILDGIKNAALSHCKVIFAASLEHAKQHFKLLSNQDCLLLLNDLPDDYI